MTSLTFRRLRLACGLPPSSSSAGGPAHHGIAEARRTVLECKARRLISPPLKPPCTFVGPRHVPRSRHPPRDGVTHRMRAWGLRSCDCTMRCRACRRACFGLRRLHAASSGSPEVARTSPDRWGGDTITSPPTSTPIAEDQWGLSASAGRTDVRRAAASNPSPIVQRYETK